LRRKCFLKHVIGGKIEGRRRRGRRRKLLLYDLKGKRSYWNSKEKALDPLTVKLALEEALGLSQGRLGAVGFIHSFIFKDWMALDP
jgi:hypothetical protein